MNTNVRNNADNSFVTRRFLFVFVCVLMGLGMGGCSFEIEGRMSEEPIEVREDMYRQMYITEDLGDDIIQQEARYFQRFGYDSMRLSVTYDPSSSSQTALWASRKAADIAEKMRRAGVRDLGFDIFPLKDNARSRTIISYTEMTARAPKECRRNTTSVNGAGKVPGDDYRFGCQVKTHLARQIYRPADLVESSNVKDTKGDAVRQSNIVNRYRSGQPAVPLDGESASGEE